MLTLINPYQIPAQIAARFRRVRLDQNVTLTQLEEISGVSQPTIQRFETTGRTTLATLVKIADALGLVDILMPLTVHDEPADLEAAIAPRPPRQRARRKIRKGTM